MEKRWRIEISDGVRFGIGLLIAQGIAAIVAVSLFMGGCGAMLVTMLEAAGS